jgi:hypothetical protein
MIEEAPPSTGPRRFGNVSFRTWYEILESRARGLLKDSLPKGVVEFRAASADGVSVLDELTPYLLGGFGSPQRLDYGTGHELSFLAFVACIWKLGGFTSESSVDGALERSIVIGVIEPYVAPILQDYFFIDFVCRYLRVVRRLILTYTLEPAGSHGVWGLDDHSFLPYIFGSSQYCPAITANDAMPIEGSLAGSPNPGDIAKKAVVDRERKHNMYFSAVGFINDVKTGPFWEHSPILFDISGVRSGWGKINKVWSICNVLFSLTLLGDDQNVQRRGPLKIPGSSALPLRIIILLGTRPECYTRLSFYTHGKPTLRPPCSIWHRNDPSGPTNIDFGSMGEFECWCSASNGCTLDTGPSRPTFNTSTVGRWG